jgi:adenylate kinase
MEKKTPLGLEISETMKSGKLVDDETTMEIFRKRLSQPDCSKGAILDGIPRTINQAEMLEELFSKLETKLDKAIYIRLSEEEILTRLTGRLTCRAQGHSFHKIYLPPKTPGICDFDGSPLYQREDQKPEAVKQRLSAYEKSTKPLLDFYEKKSLLVTINGELTVEEVSKEIAEKLALTS